MWQHQFDFYSNFLSYPVPICLWYNFIQHVISFVSSSTSSSDGQGLFSPVGRDRQWLHRPSPERVILVKPSSKVKLGTEHLSLH